MDSQAALGEVKPNLEINRLKIIQTGAANRKAIAEVKPTENP